MLMLTKILRHYKYITGNLADSKDRTDEDSERMLMNYLKYL